MISSERALRTIAAIRSRYTDDAARVRLAAAPPGALPSAAAWLDTDMSAAGIARRWQDLEVPVAARDALLDPATAAAADTWHAAIESFIGTVKLPVGIVGPLSINGLWAQGRYRVPLATTEAALVASYNRGAALLTASGGATVAMLGEGVPRTPCFVFDRLVDAGSLAVWVLENRERLRAAAEATTRHGKLIDLTLTLEGNHLYLGFVYSTGDAAGQNMTTFATEAACRVILAEAPVKPRRWFLDGNMSGDKKATSATLQGVRGRRVTAEAVVPAALVAKALGTTPADMVESWRVGVLGGVLSGSVGVQGHYANGLAALYIATGQDAACVAESAVGVTRMEVTADGALYASVTLPNVIVGTVGGGTGLPSQQACLALMGLSGPGKAHALAEVVGALCLAGEISIVGAFAAGNFSRAHEMLGRRRRAGRRGRSPG